MPGRAQRGTGARWFSVSGHSGCDSADCPRCTMRYLQQDAPPISSEPQEELGKECLYLFSSSQ